MKCNHFMGEENNTLLSEEEREENIEQTLYNQPQKESVWEGIYGYVVFLIIAFALLALSIHMFGQNPHNVVRATASATIISPIWINISHDSVLRVKWEKDIQYSIVKTDTTFIINYY